MYILALLMFPIIALVMGFYNCKEIELIIDINLFNSNYFKMGIFHEPFISPSYRMDKLTIGMLLIDIEFTFMKELEG
jgi:hypothetical protein